MNRDYEHRLCEDQRAHASYYETARKYADRARAKAPWPNQAEAEAIDAVRYQLSAASTSAAARRRYESGYRE